MARKTKQDWFYAAFQVLGETGFTGLTIDNLTTKLGVTKGSFYHHFKDYEDFKIALLDSYEQEGTLQIIQLAEEGGTPREKLKRLMEIVTAEDLPLETPIRIWAHSDLVVRAYQERIDAQRTSYLEKLCYGITGNAARARLLAKIFHYLLIGEEQYLPPPPQSELREIYQVLNQLFRLW
jgi:AcrR family transcriptional regulator